MSIADSEKPSSNRQEESGSGFEPDQQNGGFMQEVEIADELGRIINDNSAMPGVEELKMLTEFESPPPTDQLSGANGSNEPQGPVTNSTGVVESPHVVRQRDPSNSQETLDRINTLPTDRFVRLNAEESQIVNEEAQRLNKQNAILNDIEELRDTQIGKDLYSKMKSGQEITNDEARQIKDATSTAWDQWLTSSPQNIQRAQELIDAKPGANPGLEEALKRRENQQYDEWVADPKNRAIAEKSGDPNIQEALQRVRVKENSSEEVKAQGLEQKKEQEQTEQAIMQLQERLQQFLPKEATGELKDFSNLTREEQLAVLDKTREALQKEINDLAKDPKNAEKIGWLKFLLFTFGGIAAGLLIGAGVSVNAALDKLK